MSAIEKPGFFYLGRQVDPDSGQTGDVPLLYDARDLTTHAVCVGMTGSGKTGLCIDLIEEATLQGIPSILIDPKGDITNLLLTFPDLSPEQFRPWVNPDDARRKGLDLDAFAAQQAQTWREGLAKWGQGPERIQRLRQSADFTIYTPGSDAGIPVSILRTLQRPQLSWDTETEALREKISATVSALLSLVGIAADPMRSREHILLANLFEQAWRQGQDLDLPLLIQQIQSPPIRQLGVFDVDTFYPPKERFALAMALNAMIAAPSFQNWLNGAALDAGGFYRTVDGRPQVSIFYIAHLSDSERMFFVTLLLEEVLAWMRTQPGTTSLRALLYFDEIFGYFPPTANPPSKTPLLTLMKQARAFGLGVVLVTQNPVDLDYKGLTNAGTWFVGKLQTEQDKARLLEGMQGALAGGALADRRTLDDLITRLQTRVFLMNNVHASGPVLFQTRWAMSYLRGPLTREQVRLLMADRRAAASAAPLPSTPATAASAVPFTSALAAAATAPAASSAAPSLRGRPTLPPDVRQVFLPTRVRRGAAQEAFAQEKGHEIQIIGQTLSYQAAVLGAATVRFVDAQSKESAEREVVLLLDPPTGLGSARWDDATPISLSVNDLETEPEAEAAFGDVPPSANSASELAALGKALGDWLYRTQTLELPANPALDLSAAPGEERHAFQRRCEDAARARRDDELARARERYEKERDRLDEKLARAERELRQAQAAVEERKRATWVNIGESVIATILGRRSTRMVSGALSKQRMVSEAQKKIEDLQQTIADLKGQIQKVEEEFQAVAQQITDRWATASQQIETRKLSPRRNDVQVTLCALAWEPFWEFQYVDAQGLTRQWRVSAWARQERSAR